MFFVFILKDQKIQRPLFANKQHFKKKKTGLVFGLILYLLSFLP
jgi:hypothetical protein